MSESVQSLELDFDPRRGFQGRTAGTELATFLTSRRWSNLKDLVAYDLPAGLPQRLKELHPGIRIVDSIGKRPGADPNESDDAYHSSEGE